MPILQLLFQYKTSLRNRFKDIHKSEEILFTMLNKFRMVKE